VSWSFGFVALLLVLCGCRSRPAAPVIRLGSIVIQPGYATASPTGDGGAAYFTIRNEGAAADTLREVAVDSGPAVLHAIEREGGTTRMVPMEAALAAGDSIALRVGAAHLMFQERRRTIKLGDTVRVELTFARAGRALVPLPVGLYGGK
jgi:copper(I)-binding protein